MTLVEAVAGLALLGSVVTGLLMTKASLARRTASLRRQTEAADVCDRLLTRWLSPGNELPRSADGTWGEGLHWSIHPVRLQRALPPPLLSIEVLRLDVRDQDTSTLLTSVEVVAEAKGAAQ